MYILTNAFKNLGRNKGRNILLGIIIFTIILSTTVALVINSTTKGIIEDYKTRFGSKVTLSVDFDKLMANTEQSENGTFNFPTAPQITAEQHFAFSKSKHLKSFVLNSTTGIAFDKLKAIDEDKNQGMTSSIGNGSQQEQEEYVVPKAKLIAYSDVSKLPDFKDGLRKIMDGKIFKNKNECIISSDFANLNKLKVGDELEIVETYKSKTIKLKISGIYADATSANETLPEGTFSLEGSYGNRRNEILVNMDTMSENLGVNNMIVVAEYELKSPELLAEFETELRGKGLPEAYDVLTDEAGYNSIVAPVIGLADISMTFMWVILAVGGIILLFITSMAIRERKYEIGVLRAMGLKKSKIGFMLMSEMMMITGLCLVLGLGVGSIVSQPVADVLISGQVEATKNIIQQPQGGISVSGGAVGSIDQANKEKPLSEIAVSLSMEAVLQICLIAFGLALLSSTAGVIFITKYEPMKILSERN